MQDIIKHTVAQRRQRICIVAIMDILCIAAAFFAGLLIRYEFSFSAIPERFLSFYSTTIIPWIGISLIVFMLFGLYKSIWSFFMSVLMNCSGSFWPIFACVRFVLQQPFCCL